MELVLSLDGGRTFPIRLTGRIPIGASSVSWTRSGARLRGRPPRASWRAATRPRSPRSSSPSASPSPSTLRAGRPIDELFLVGSEWRTREALEGLPARDAPRRARRRSRGPALGAGVDDEARRRKPSPVRASPVLPPPSASASPWRPVAPPSVSLEDTGAPLSRFASETSRLPLSSIPQLFDEERETRHAFRQNSNGGNPATRRGSAGGARNRRSLDRGGPRGAGPGRPRRPPNPRPGPRRSRRCPRSTSRSSSRPSAAR